MSVFAGIRFVNYFVYIKIHHFAETAAVERKEEELREAYNYFVRNVSEYHICAV